MIVALLLGLAGPVQATTAPAPSDDAVVTARRLERLKRLRVVARKDRRTGIVRCIVKRRSGDPRLDAEVCAVAVDCAARVRREAEIVPCVAPAMAALVPKTPWTAGRAANSR